MDDSGLDHSRSGIAEIVLVVIEFRDGESVGIDNHESDGEEGQWEDDAQEWAEREPTPAHLLHQVDSEERADEIDGGHQGRQPNGFGRVVESGHLNDGSAVVHDRVDSGNLLEHLQEAAEEEGPQDGRTLKDLDENVGRLASLTSVLLKGKGGGGTK